MVLETKFEGIIPPISTIFDSEKNLDRQGMRSLIDQHINKGVNGLLVLGSGGEFSQMSFEMRKEVAEFSISYTNNRVPILIGTGSTSTQESILLSKHAENEGADGVMVINPYYWTLPEESLLNHYLEIAKNVEFPVLLYNFPELTGQDLTPEFVLKLVNRTQNIVGIKETVDSIGHVRSMISKVKKEHPDFKVFAGLDDHLLNTLQMGGDGAIPSSANFAPEITVDIFDAYKNRDFDTLETLHKKLMNILDVYKISTPLYIAIKQATRLRGLEIGTTVLPPAQDLNEEGIYQIKQILKDAELL